MGNSAMWGLAREAGLVFDVGMHRGQDTRFYLEMGYRVVAVEAEPGLVEAARQNFASEIADGRLRLVHCVIAAEDGPVSFWTFPGKEEWNTADPGHAAQAIAAGFAYVQIALPGRRFGTILSEFGVPHYLKIDIEGADLLCVEALAQFSPCPPSYLSLEVSRASGELAFGALAMLHALGYRRFKLVDQALNPSRPAKLPSGAKFEFKMGSSGAFGEGTPGTWREAFAAARELDRALRWERLLAPGGDLRPGAWMVNALSRLWPQRASLSRWRAALTTASWLDLHAALPADAAMAKRVP